LKQRGSLTFWIDEAVLAGWVEPELSGNRGESRYYSDMAIATMATIKSVYGLAGRQCQGFLESIFALMGLEPMTIAIAMMKLPNGKPSP
jgi:hypothetical protein